MNTVTTDFKSPAKAVPSSRATPLPGGTRRRRVQSRDSRGDRASATRAKSARSRRWRVRVVAMRRPSVPHAGEAAPWPSTSRPCRK
ncbi:hypothetical protein E2562_007012 [Oryza meyeriana var. granulata]|uniref:Uncharacterized protein n=1 Tax=Oryza meyeriana var. granulata TaxID=110450 RepID=A0A6G1EAL6_9ORYZ|nr:hypothetical protein E2562_007012 [Oryza meyeriana var. granulata]